MFSALLKPATASRVWRNRGGQTAQERRRAGGLGYLSGRRVSPWLLTFTRTPRRHGLDSAFADRKNENLAAMWQNEGGGPFKWGFAVRLPGRGALGMQRNWRWPHWPTACDGQGSLGLGPVPERDPGALTGTCNVRSTRVM